MNRTDCSGAVAGPKPPNKAIGTTAAAAVAFRLDPGYTATWPRLAPGPRLPRPHTFGWCWDGIACGPGNRWLLLPPMRCQLGDITAPDRYPYVPCAIIDSPLGHPPPVTSAACAATAAP